MLDRNPTIAVLGAWVYVLTGRPVEGARWERAAQQSTATPELPDGSASRACGLAMAAAARVAVHEGDVAKARGHVAKVHRLRALFNHGLPWLSVQTGLELTRVHLALGEASVARAVLSESEGILRVRPHLGTLGEEARELRQRVAATSTSSGAWALSLTAAELRLLPLLTTHLAFPQVGERLFLSRNTVKTHAISIYRKFGVSSRAEAIERAVELGLLEDSLYPARAKTALPG